MHSSRFGLCSYFGREENVSVAEIHVILSRTPYSFLRMCCRAYRLPTETLTVLSMPGFLRCWKRERSWRRRRRWTQGSSFPARRRQRKKPSKPGPGQNLHERDVDEPVLAGGNDNDQKQQCDASTAAAGQPFGHFIFRSMFISLRVRRPD